MFRVEDEKGFYRSQVGFIDYLALPLWKCITNTFPELALLSDNIEANKRTLQSLLEDQSKKESKEDKAKVETKE